MDRVQADIALLERLTIGTEARRDVIQSSTAPGSVERLWLLGGLSRVFCHGDSWCLDACSALDAA